MIDLARPTVVRTLLRSRWPQLLVTTLALAALVFAVTAGLAGTPVGSRNLAVVLVWIAWWALLILVAVPLGGRAWCSVCPVPAPGEWLQRGAVLGPAKRGLGLAWRWPRALRNMWLQNGAFAAIALVSVVILTSPIVTALVLGGLVVAAVVVSVLFERRAFCRYVCPVGGFIGLYAQAAPLAIRVKDAALCAAHREKTCYTGSADGYGCPWQVFPGGLRKNTYCGTCVECLRTCPYDNVAVYARPFGADLSEPSGRRLDEAAKAFVMLGSAVAYVAVLAGPWGALKTAAYEVGSLRWLAYAAAFLAFTGAVLPGLFLGAVALGRAAARSTAGMRRSFVAFAYALVPLGLAAWIAFSLSFVLVNASYLWPALSDPMGWGWNLFGTAGVRWRPYATGLVPALQTAVLLVGLFWASGAAYRTAGELTAGERRRRGAALCASPVMLFCLAVTLGLLGLMVG